MLPKWRKKRQRRTDRWNLSLIQDNRQVHYQLIESILRPENPKVIFKPMFTFAVATLCSEIPLCKDHIGLRGHYGKPFHLKSVFEIPGWSAIGRKAGSDCPLIWLLHSNIGMESKEVKGVRSSDEPPPKKTKWVNRQRLLIFASRGINHRSRHLMINLRTLLPHSKPESKMEKKDTLHLINEICEMKNCNKCIYLEQKKKQDLYMWMSNVPDGPSVKFLVENVHTMEELKLTGNCLKGSRAILSFDKSFTEHPQYSLLQELFVQVFGTPLSHPKSQPFIDHVFTFAVLDNRIWFRNYQIIEENGALAEIGPRFALNPVRIFMGSFGGPVLWDNEHYVTPSMHRRLLKKQATSKLVNRIESKLSLEKRKPEFSYKLDDLDDVFQSESNPQQITVSKKRKRPTRKPAKK